MKPCNESEIVGLKSMQPSKDYYKGYDAAEKNYMRVLDKLRAEIENHCGLTKENHCKYCSYCNSVMGVREILEILNKYKAESEER